LVDGAAAVATACPSEPCPAVLYADHRPTAGGYRLMAEALARDLKDAM
jgi:hypothetical protein